MDGSVSIPQATPCIAHARAQEAPAAVAGPPQPRRRHKRKRWFVVAGLAAAIFLVSQLVRAGAKLVGTSTRPRIGSSLAEISLIRSIDGEACGADSTLGLPGLVLWLALVCYIFVGLALICDDYFVGSLEKIARKLRMSDDVAGATLMAGGTSSPELFAALVGVFLDPDEDTGPSTILGSVVFNVAVIIGGSLWMSDGVSRVSSVAMVRDCVFNFMCIVALFVMEDATSPGQISVTEATLLLAIYALYILSMKYSAAAVSYFTRLSEDEGPKHTDLEDLSASRKKPSGVNVEASHDDAADESRVKLLSDSSHSDDVRMSINSANASDHSSTGLDRKSKQTSLGDGSEQQEPSNEETRSQLSYEQREPRTATERIWRIFKSMMLGPWEFALGVTIPDCSKERWASWYVLTFVNCILWLAVTSFLMVDLANKIGDCLGLKPNFTGFTLLAIGSSLPDCLSSFIASRHGKVEMAVCNALGSNVFDICIGLGVPLFLHTTIFGKPFPLPTTNFELFIVAGLILLVFFFLILRSRWIAYRYIGKVMIFGYVLFLVVLVTELIMGTLEND